ATFTSGKVGQAFSLDGVDDYVSIPDSASLRPATQLTLEGWFNFAATDGSRIMISKTVGPRFEKSYALWIFNGALNGTVTDFEHSGTHESVDYALNPTIGQWYHLAYTFDDASDTQKLYVNGQLVATKIQTNTIAYDGHPVVIGAQIDFGGPPSEF